MAAVELSFPVPCFSGPGVNKAVLLQQQQEDKKEEMKNKMREMYENMSYLEDEVTREADSSSAKAAVDFQEASQTEEKGEKEVRKD